MKRFLLIAIPVFLIGFVAGNAFWYLASPLWIDTVVNETIAGPADQQVVAMGAFRDADGVHRGQGVAEILQGADGSLLLTLTDFEVTNGPDLEVWLTSAVDPAKSSDVKAATNLPLGQLKGNIGNQSYPIAAGTDLSTYRSVVIWCEQFGVLFSPAVFVTN